MAGDVASVIEDRFRGITITSNDGSAMDLSSIKLTVLDAAEQDPTAAAVWYTPNVSVSTGDGTSTIVAYIEVGPNGDVDPGAGYWRVWAQITDSPETLYTSNPNYFCLVDGTA